MKTNNYQQKTSTSSNSTLFTLKQLSFFWVSLLNKSERVAIQKPHNDLITVVLTLKTLLEQGVNFQVIIRPDQLLNTIVAILNSFYDQI